MPRECIVELNRVEYLTPLIRLSETYGPLDIFTTNYDVVVDQFATWSGMRIFDGLGMQWNPSEFSDRTKGDAFLYRLHGSITWYQSTSFGFLKLPVREGDEGLVFLSGEKAEALLLYPAQKEVLHSPFVFCLNALHQRLRAAQWCVVVGYSFRDGQLLGAFQEAGAENLGLRLILVSPDAESSFQTFLERRSREGSPSPFDRDSNPSRVLRLPYGLKQPLTTLCLPSSRSTSRPWN